MYFCINMYDVIFYLHMCQPVFEYDTVVDHIKLITLYVRPEYMSFGNILEIRPHNTFLRYVLKLRREVNP